MNLAFSIPDWKQIFIVIGTSIILAIFSFLTIRFFAGKKSISQMTLPQMVAMLALGAVITKPLNDNKTIIGACISILVFIFFMMFLEQIALKTDKGEPFLDSTPDILILDGKIQENGLKKNVMTVDQLESFLRQKGISSIKDVRTCVMEIDGRIGYEEFKNYKPNKDNIFDEIRNQKHNKSVKPQLD